MTETKQNRRMNKAAIIWLHGKSYLYISLQPGIHSDPPLGRSSSTRPWYDTHGRSPRGQVYLAHNGGSKTKYCSNGKTYDDSARHPTMKAPQMTCLILGGFLTRQPRRNQLRRRSETKRTREIIIPLEQHSDGAVESLSRLNKDTLPWYGSPRCPDTAIGDI